MAENSLQVKMAASGSGAVFFLGSRAHYQVLQQPGAGFEPENGNASTETIYQNPTVRNGDVIRNDDIIRSGDVIRNGELIRNGHVIRNGDVIRSGDLIRNGELIRNGHLIRNDNRKKDKGDWSYENEVNIMDEGHSVKRRSKLHSSETALLEKDANMLPTVLNISDESISKKKPRRKLPLFGFLTSLTRRKKKMEEDRAEYLQRAESVLLNCTYRESCRCLDCQSNYFECAVIDDGHVSDDNDCVPEFFDVQEEIVNNVYFDQPGYPQYPDIPEEDEDPEYPSSEEEEEVLVEPIPEDDPAELLRQLELLPDDSDEEIDPNMQLEVVAGTPIFLNFILTHPVTCVIQ